MSEETLDPKPNVGGPTPRIKTGNVKKDAPKPDFSKGLGFSYSEGNESVQPTPSPKPKVSGTPAVQVKPKINTGGGFKTEPQPSKTTPEQQALLKKAGQSAQQTINQNFRLVSVEEQEARDKELESLVGKELDIQNLFTATKQGDEVIVGKQSLKTPEELESFLSDPSQRSSFYNEKRQDLAKFFNIASEKDFTGKVTGGLSEFERTRYTDNTLATIYDPIFRKKSVTVGQPGYRAEYDQFAPDPIAEQYQIAQRTYQATQQFNQLSQNNIATDAYGQKFEKPEDFYTYLRDPLNREAYQRRFGKDLKEIGISNVNDLLKPVILESGNLGAIYSRSEVDSKMRVAKGTDIVKRDVLGKTAVVFDENENSSSLPNVSESDLGKLLYEYDLGNNINLDIPNADGRGYTSITRDSLVSKLESSGLQPDEVDQILEGYRSEYEQSMGMQSYSDKRAKMGFGVDAKGVRYSNYDQAKEQRALSELTQEERKISELYDQIRELYASGTRVKGKKDIVLSPEQQKKINGLRSQIEQLKRDSGFFGFNAIPQQEFLDPEGNRLEGADKEKTQTVFSNTFNAEKKTDISILKERRNVLYEQLDALNEKYKKSAGKGSFGLDVSGLKVVLPENYDRDKLNADFEEARAKDTPYGVGLLQGMVGGGDIVYTDQMKANYIYRRKLKDKILEKQAQIKAVNKIIYTNADLTKVQASGVFYNMFTDVSKGIAETFTGESYLTPTEEITQAANFLQSNGMYVNPEVVDSLKGLNEDQMMGQGVLGSLGIALQLGLYGKGAKGSMSKLFTSNSAVAARSYMGSRYGRTGVATFSMLEKAAVNYGVNFATYEAAGLDGSAGVAEEVGSQIFDRVTGVLKLGRFIPANVIGKMMTMLGRTVSGAAGSFTEETFANVWTEMKQNGFDVQAAVRDAYGDTDDERLFTLRSLAFSSIVFSAANISNLGVLFKTKTEFQSYLDNNYGDNVSEADRELLDLLDQTIKNTSNDDDANGVQELSLATATASAVDGRVNFSDAPVDEPIVMSSGPVEADQRTSNATAAGSGAGSEGVQVEKRTGNMGEEFYVAGKNGVVDNKVVYRYNSETGELEAKGLTSTTEDFVSLNQKTRDFVETQSKEYGIVSKEKVENIAIKNVEARRAERQKRESGEPIDDNRVAYQAPTETSRRKKERISKVEQSAKARYNPTFNEQAQARVGLFTGVAEEVKVEDEAVKETASEMSRGFGTKMKINLTSFFKDGKAVITDLARKKAAKVSDYMAPLFKDFDGTFFTKTDHDLETDQPVMERQSDAITDKVRESVARNTFFNEVFGRMVSEGRMSREDAIDNFIINLLQNSTAKAKEIFGNDKAGMENFSKLRKDFNNFVAVKYTGANTFSTTNAFVRNTPMSTSTTKNRKADMKKEAAQLAEESIKRQQVKSVLKSTEEKGAFVTEDQVDAIRYKTGEITADEFLENIGAVAPVNYTAEQKNGLADSNAAQLVDFEKYQEAVDLIAQNDKTRADYRKKLSKQAGLVWGFKPSLKTIFKAKRSRAERKAYVEIYLRAIEEAATRNNMTLQTFMDTQIGVLKRTEKQFIDFLGMTPDLVPLYQVAANYKPEDVLLNFEKASDLKQKGFDQKQIELMTGLTFNEAGEVSIASDNIKIDFNSKFQSELWKLVSSLKKNITKENLPKIKNLLGRFNLSEFGVDSVLTGPKSVVVKSLFELIKGNADLLDKYPDLSQVNIRFIQDNTSPTVSFKPNAMYTGKGKGFNRPGDIVVNLNEFISLTDSGSLDKLLQGSNKTAFESAIRKAIQHTEGELDQTHLDDVVSPSTFRSTVAEARKAGAIDQDTSELMNKVLDFYIDKAVFQYSNYQSLFFDIAQTLYRSSTKNNLETHFEKIAADYDLSEGDIQELRKIFGDYTDKVKNEGRSFANTFEMALKLGGLNNSKLLDYDFAASFSTKVDYNKSSQNKGESFSPEDLFESVDFIESISSLSSLVESLNSSKELLKKADISEQFEKLSKLVKSLSSEIKTGKVSPITVSSLVGMFAGKEGSQVLDFVDAVLNEFPIEQVDEFGNFSGEFYLEPSQFGVDFETLADQLNSLSEESFNAVDKIAKVSFDESNAGDSEDTRISESKELYYQMFPGIDQYMNGIYDPFKKIEDFTKAELRTSLVDSGLVTSVQFDRVYAAYEQTGKMTGSVASNFLGKADLNDKQRTELINFLAAKNAVMKNFGTSFYVNSEYAAAKIATQQKRIPAVELKAALLSNGAKPGELDWLGIDDFVGEKIARAQMQDPSINPDSVSISREELMEWASNIPTVFSYDPNEETQVRVIESVTILPTTGEVGQATEKAFSMGTPFALNSDKFYRPEFYADGVVSYNFAVKFADSSVRVINAGDISQDNLEVFKHFVATEEFKKFSDAIKNIEVLKSELQSNPQAKDLLKNYVKIYVQLEDEMKRSSRFRGATLPNGGSNLHLSYAANKPVFGDAAVPNTYREHTISTPVSQNRVFKNFNDRILSVLEEMEKLTSTPESISDAQAKAKLQTLTERLDKLVDKRNSLARDLYNSQHFNNPNEVLGHLRTEVVYDSDGTPCLFVHEMQSDKSQKVQSDIKPIRDEMFDEFVIEKLFKFKNRIGYDSEFGNELVRFIFKNKNKIASALGKPAPLPSELDKIKKEQGFEKFVDAAVEIVSSYGKTLRSENLDLFKDFDEQVNASEKVNRLKETTPLLATESFMDMLIKQSIKIASDNGLSKIIFTGGSRIGPQVAPEKDAKAKTKKGINQTYNDKIPSRLKKMAKKMGYTVGASRVSGDTVDLGDKVNLEVKVDPKLLPSYKVNENTAVENKGQDIPLSLIPEDIRDQVLMSYTGEEYIPNTLFHSIELSNTTHQITAEGSALFQSGEVGAHGAFLKTESGKNLIFALTNPNISTAMHELAHMFEQYMTATEKQIFMEQVGDAEWSRDTSEKFARGFEKYLYDGKSPNGSLNSVFENFKKWLLRIYGGIVGTPIEMKVSEPMRKIYDAVLGETTVSPLKQRKSSDVFDDIGEFIKELKSNPQFEGVTDDELYTALMRSGFEPNDVQDYFSLKQRANIAKQQQKKGPFQQEADLIQDEAEAMRVVRDQKELVDSIENMDPTEYPVILQTLFDIMEDGDVPLAKAISDLIAAKQRGGDPETIAKQYSAILKAGTSVGRMLQLFRQLTKDTYLSSAEGMFRRNEKKGLNIPDQAKDKIRNAAQELDQLKDLYKQSRDIASSDPYGTSKADPSKTNLQYNIELYEKLQQAVKRFVDARMPFEGDDSITDMYRSFIKGGLMTPGSVSVNTLSNITKFFTGLLVDPIKSAISFGMFKTGITAQQSTKTSLKDWWSGVKYGMPSGASRAYKILKDGTMTQGYQTPDSYVQGFSFYKSFAKFFGLKMDQIRRAAGQLNITDAELADKHGFKVNMLGEIPSKQQAIAGLQATFGIIPDLVFRVMGATDAVFRDFSYYAAVSEQFKFTKEHNRYISAIKNAKDPKDKKRLREEYDAVRKAYIQINSDFQNTEANEEAMRYVYTNDNATTDIITKIQGITRTDINNNSVFAKMTRLAGTAVIPFTRIPSNYAVELMEFFIPEYALVKIGTNGYKSYSRSRKLAAGDSVDMGDVMSQRNKDARSLDRILARALVGTGIQFFALQIVKAGAISGGPDDENEEDKQKSMTFSYSLERPYSINLSLVKDEFMKMMNPDYKSKRSSRLWDKENDLIVDYRAMGVFGAALYLQFKENKLALEQSNKYINRGEFAKITEDFALNMFGNFESAASYIIDQTFVRGIMSMAKAISDEDENKLASFLADMTLTLSAGMVPNSLAWIDKWNRKFVVDYDAKEAPSFKAFGMKIEDPQATLFWTKLATKMAERWPIGDPQKYVDLPFVESQLDYIPVKVDAFGKDIEQTPKGASMGALLYNTFDVFKASRVKAGYDTPDWESLVYLAVKKGEVWNAIPSLLPRNVKTPSGMYKYAPNEYNNLLQYNSLIKRELVYRAFIKGGQYKDLIDPNSRINKDQKTGKPVTGINNTNVLIGYEILGNVLSEIYSAANKITDLYTYAFIDKERKKLLQEDPDKFYALVRKEMLSPMGAMQRQLYGGQENQYDNLAQTVAELNKFDVTADFLVNPKLFEEYSTGAMKLFLEFNADPKTAIITAQNQTSDVKNFGNSTINGIEEVPLDDVPPAPTKKSPVVEAVKQQRKQVEKQAPSTVNGIEEIPFE